MSINNILENDEDDYIYIQGVKISDDEEEIINDLIHYIKDDRDSIFNYFSQDEPIFKIDENIKWYKLHYEVIEKNKDKFFYLFKDDVNIYAYNTLSYIKLKKQLFIYFKRLLYLLRGDIDEDLINYLNINFFSDICKTKYYKCLNWFIALFYYFFNSIINLELRLNVINYNQFRKWSLKYRKTNQDEKIKNILCEFKNIDFKRCRHYEDIKIFLNFVIPNVAHGWGGSF